MVPMTFLMGAGIGALESRERFGLANVITVLTIILGQIGPVVVAIVFGPSLGLVVPAIALASLFSLLPLLVMVYREEVRSACPTLAFPRQRPCSDMAVGFR